MYDEGYGATDESGRRWVTSDLLKVSRRFVPFSSAVLGGEIPPRGLTGVGWPLNFVLRYHRRVVYGVPASIRNRTLIIVAVWALWRTRNKYIYEDQEPSISFIHNIFRSELDRALQLQFTRRGADKFHGIWMHQQINLANTICITNGRPKLLL